MDVKQAIAQAKRYLADLYEGEEIQDVGLEEVSLDDEGHVWRITLGFTRPWDRGQSAIAAALNSGSARAKRSYKLIYISDSTGAALPKMADLDRQ